MEDYIEKNLKTYSVISAYERLTLSNRLAVFCGTCVILFDLARTGLFSNFIMKFVMILSYGVVILQFKLIKKGYMNSSTVSLIIGETYNLVLIYLSYVHYPEFSVIWGQIATCVIFYYQGYLCLSLKTCFMLSLKHSTLWIAFGFYYRKIQFSLFSCFCVSSFYLFACLVQTIYYEHKVTVKILKSNYEVKSANDKVTSILETLQDYIIVLSQDNKELFINSSARGFTGFSLLVDKLKGFPYSKTYKNSFFENEQISLDIQKTLSLPLNSCIHYGVVTGEHHHIEWTGKIIKWDDANVLMLSGRVITKIIELEKENRENSYRGALINTVSHELRTPANAILSIGNLILESKQLSKENKKKMKTIQASCSFQLCLINDLLDYAQIVAGCLKVTKVSMNLFNLLKECVSLITPQLNSNVKLETEIKNSPENIVSDPNRLKQIILNLINNARKFTLKGLIKLEVIYESSRLKFTCSDTGIGIPTNKLGTLFKEFSKIEESNNFNLQGVGLGLVISNQLVKALGGEGILVNSEFGVGSSFIFEVSAEESYNSACDIANEGINISVPSLLAKTMHRKIEVLIVDDVYFNIIALLEMFKQTGIICKYAMNGEEAIEKVMKNNFSCILMDCEMPIMDGWQTSKKLKTLQQEKAILNLPPILACTAYQSEIIKAKCFDHGMCDVIQKPCPREMLFERVHYWILFYLNHL